MEFIILILFSVAILKIVGSKFKLDSKSRSTPTFKTRSTGKCKKPQYQKLKNYDANRGSIKPAKSNAEIWREFDSLPVCQVLHIIDGDTVILTNEQGIDERIRLSSIDCPEDGQKWGDIATAGLIKLIGGRKITLERHGTDGYGRTIATLYCWSDRKDKWLSVNQEMVMLGHAWVMRRYYNHLPTDRKNKLNQLENWAKRKKVGLWGQENPIPPWKYRGQ